MVVAEQSFPGGCMAVAGYRGKVVVGVNSEVHVLDFDPGSLSLQSLCRKAEQVCVTCLSADEASQTLAVGDVLRSVSLYRLTVELLAGRQLAQLELLASERVRRNVTAMTRLPEDPNRLLVCDAYGNLCILALAEDREIDRSNPQRRLAPREWLHLDDQVNRVVAGSLFRGGRAKAGEGAGAGVEFRLVFCTVSGRVGLVGAVEESEFAVLRALEDAMDAVGTERGFHIGDHAGGRIESCALETQRDAVRGGGDGVLRGRRHGGAVLGGECGREGDGGREGECGTGKTVLGKGDDRLRAGYSDQALRCLLESIVLRSCTLSFV